MTTEREAGFPVHVDVEVRFRDVDGMRHVNNAVYFTYMEMARGAYWSALGLGGPGEGVESLSFILARTECDFRAPIAYGEIVRVWIRCPRLGRKSWDFEYRLEGLDSDVLFAEARSVQVFYDYTHRRGQEIPSEVRRRIERLEGQG